VTGIGEGKLENHHRLSGQKPGDHQGHDHGNAAVPDVAGCAHARSTRGHSGRHVHGRLRGLPGGGGPRGHHRSHAPRGRRIRDRRQLPEEREESHPGWAAHLRLSRGGQSPRQCRGDRRRREALADHLEGCRAGRTRGLLCLWSLSHRGIEGHHPSRKGEAVARGPSHHEARSPPQRALLHGFHLYDSRLPQPLPLLPGDRHVRLQDPPQAHRRGRGRGGYARPALLQRRRQRVRPSPAEGHAAGEPILPGSLRGAGRSSSKALLGGCRRIIGSRAGSVPLQRAWNPSPARGRRSPEPGGSCTTAPRTASSSGR